jgi:hypothetical protein
MPRPAPIKTLGCITAMAFIAMALQSAPLEPSIPAIQLTFSEHAFRSILDRWQAAGVSRFKTHFLFDFPLLVSYGCFGYAVSRQTALFRRLHGRTRSLLAWSLPTAAIADAIENVLHLGFVFASGTVPGSLYFVSGGVASIKWLLIIIFVLAAAYAVLRSSR